MTTVQFSNVDNIIAAFCKDTKASKAKTLAMVEALRASVIMPEGSSAPREHKDRTKDESYKVREYVMQHIEELKGRTMTNKALAEMVGVEPYVVANNIKWLKDEKNLITYTGYGEKPAGQRGRKPQLWMINA